MSKVPPDLRYTREHEWARVESDNNVRVGITDFAQEQLGDVVYLDLPAEGAAVTAGAAMGEVESTKSVSDIYSPVDGSVAGVNTASVDNPAGVNQDPYGDGWLVLISPSDPAAVERLMTSDEYEKFLVEEAGEDGS